MVVVEEFIPRMNAALSSIRTNLIAAGVPAGNITVEELDSTDLRWEINALRGARRLRAFIELTDATHTGGPPGHAIFTFWVDGDGTEITHSYAPGGRQPYTTQAGLDALLAKLAQAEATLPEIRVKVRAHLGL